MTAYGSSTVKRGRRTKAELVEVDDAIVAAVRDEHPVTLRGVYYRVVSAGAVPKTENAYRTVGRRLLELRRSGRVPYSWITDGTRLIRKPASWTDVDAMLDAAASSYRRALWNDQAAEVIVLSEKDAISGAVYPVTAKWDVELGITRGYSSETFVHSIAETVLANTRAGKTTFLYNLGDHDPSGVDAWRDFTDKVTEFIGGRGVAHFTRLAVTEDQVTRYALPTRPTKAKDARAGKFTGGSVEVDALPASVLRSIVENAILQHIDEGQLETTLAVEDEERQVLTRLASGGAI